MEKWIMIIMLLLLPACKIQKHIETERMTLTETVTDKTETTDKNTTKFITIYEYQTIYDTIRKEYPIKSKTEIKEVNNDKVVVESKTENNEIVNEQSKKDNQTEPSYKWYIVCYVLGVVSVIVLILLFKLVKWYIKRGCLINFLFL